MSAPAPAAAFHIGRHPVGPGHAPLFWPDIDLYFRGDESLAFRLIDQLREAGVQFLKSAVLHDADCCLPGPTTSYFVAGRGMVTEAYRAVIERHVMPLPAMARLCEHARGAGLELVLSVYDQAGLQFALDQGAVAVKIPSSNIVHAPLIRAAAACGRPLVLDTGRSQLAEIERAVAWARAAGARELLIQHSPPGPPAPPARFHLASMPELGRRFGVPFGLSDHFAGTAMFPLAVALGASVIEKGVAADAQGADIDLSHALPIAEAASALAGIRLAFESLGAADLPDRELPAAPRDRMGLVAAKAIAAGEPLGEGNVRFAFPAEGVPIERWDAVAGRLARRAIAPGQPITDADLGG